ncbi:protoporphyrinogen oxidase HemJ [Curvivirga aplysinae]|uniref:protoporphyrinogen oxidase HemJ n=1 Tax=Curvivirga aplysinae TaxID=2529852 RepID=UPI0012BD2779|nr:protoporphyrinogen oxidase HemJ [Curvivirga aplysinae]MTI08278.1 protoporphyrinogen oxidase HemJ [Curvivirga aplysinae]
MFDWIDYNWVKAVHVIAVISWMAGLLYLPRLFVYHVAATPGSEHSETLKIMERRLMKAIMTPAMGVTWLAGLYLLWDGGWMSDGWMHAKLTCVVLMSIAHEMMKKWMKDFANDKNTKSQKFFRIANEVPTVLMIIVVVMVIVKPF